MSMFDLKNPADLKMINNVVIGNTDVCPALYDYKCVLADVKHNLLGFAEGGSYAPNQAGYLLFSWENQSFLKLMERRLDCGEGLDQIRGICIGNTFYLVHPGEICSYNREEGYSFIEKITL